MKNIVMLEVVLPIKVSSRLFCSTGASEAAGLVICKKKKTADKDLNIIKVCSWLKM
jgi:hypothetical protein